MIITSEPKILSLNENCPGLRSLIVYVRVFPGQLKYYSQFTNVYGELLYVMGRIGEAIVGS